MAKLSSGWKALHVASKKGSESTVKSLLANGATTNEIDNERRTAPHVAANNGAKKVARTLLEEGASVNTRNHDGCIAAKNGLEATVRLLFDNEADINTINDLDMTPLHLATIYGHEKVVRVFGERGMKTMA